MSKQRIKKQGDSGRIGTSSRRGARGRKATTSSARSSAERAARRRQRSGDLEVPSAAHAGGPIPPIGVASPLPALPGEDRAPGELPTTAQRQRRPPKR